MKDGKVKRLASLGEVAMSAERFLHGLMVGCHVSPGVKVLRSDQLKDFAVIASYMLFGGKYVTDATEPAEQLNELLDVVRALGIDSVLVLIQDEIVDVMNRDLVTSSDIADDQCMILKKRGELEASLKLAESYGLLA